MNIEIREYREEDKKFIPELMNRFQDYLVGIDPLKRLRRTPDYGEVYAADFLNRIEKHHGKMYVATDEGALVGLVGGILLEQTELDLIGTYPRKGGRIVELFVDANYRGAGIGKAFMEKMEHYFREQKCSISLVEIFGPNRSAHAFYERIGYENRDYDLQKEL